VGYRSSENHQHHSSHFCLMHVRPAIPWKEQDSILLNSLRTAMNTPDTTRLLAFSLLTIFDFFFNFTCIVLFFIVCPVLLENTVSTLSFLHINLWQQVNLDHQCHSYGNNSNLIN